LYHALNRGNAKAKIFRKQADYDAFLNVLDEGLGRYEVELLAFCLLPNHWHMILRPQRDGAMGQFVGWVTATHTLRYHAHYQTVGSGHLYQGPFKSFPVQDDEHFLTVARYVERNALSAGLCRRAEDWIHGSLHRWLHKCDRDPKLLTNWPIRRPSGWVDRVNAALTAKELERIRLSVRRGRPYGAEEWTESTCERTGLWSTVRPLGRPPKRPQSRAPSIPR
jgi:putative transposase